MRLSISRSMENIWVWLFWALGIYLVLELGPFLIAGYILRKTAGAMAGPYLAFAMPWAIMAPLIWWLRKWEEQGASPKRLARGWGLSMLLFGVVIQFAVFYSGVQLSLIRLNDAIISFVAAALFNGLVFYFGMYHMALNRISSRATNGDRKA
jgi:hypothetical protein